MKNKKDSFSEMIEGISPYRILGDIGHAAALERFGPKVSERIAWCGNPEEAKIALTFDDGPHAVTTPLLIETLHESDTAATFFLVGKHIESHPEIARMLLKAGHELGNHTYSHAALSFLTSRQIRDEISLAEKAIQDTTGASPHFLRPPNGFFTRRVLDIAEEMDYRVVIGDVYPRDPHRPGTGKIVARVLQRTKNGSIIILHDGGNTRRVDRSQTLSAVAELIPRLKSNGFQFVTLSELLN